MVRGMSVAPIPSPAKATAPAGGRRLLANRPVVYAVCVAGALLAGLVLWAVSASDDGVRQGEAGEVPTEGPLAAGGRASANPPPSPSPPPPGAIWQAVAPDSVDPETIPPYKEIVEGRALVRVVDPWRPLAAGDDLVVTIPQLGETYRPVVERVVTGPGSSRSVAGTVTASDGQPRLFVYTVGARSAFAFIDTPHGTYELVANRELGWLMPTANMDQHVDYTLPDTFPVARGRLARPSDVPL